jgi:hypothetical protein
VKNHIVCFVDEDELVFLQKKVTSLPLNEEIIIAKSIEYYDDPDPCMIHKSAIMKLMYIQINDVLNEKLIRGQQKILWAELPDNIKEYLKFSKNVQYLMFNLIK